MLLSDLLLVIFAITDLTLVMESPYILLILYVVREAIYELYESTKYYD